MYEPPRTVNLRGWRITAFTEQQCVSYILEALKARQGGWLVTANLDVFRRLVRKENFASLCRKASLIVADGMPLIWVSRIQGNALPERVAGSNLVYSLSAGAAINNRSVFLLGGESGTAEAAAKALYLKFPNLQIAGTYCPSVGHLPNENDEEIGRITDVLSQSQPDIVYVALGSPKQEIVIDCLRPHFPDIWWLGVGISFSYLCGRIRRPPLWIRKAGFEWLCRLGQEPHRLTRRYLIDDFPFFFIMLLQSAFIGMRRNWMRSTRARR